jgi:hypothetical protein
MDLQHKTSATLFSYWESVRGDRQTPRRFEIDPAKIAGILPSTFILERVDVDTYRYRLAGTRVCEIFGTELRGANFLDGWTPADRLSLVRHLAALAKQGAIEKLLIEAAAAARTSTPFEVLLLPLRHTGDEIDRILGAFSPLDPPYWLGELPISFKRIISHELSWPDGAAAAAHPDDRPLGEVPVLAHTSGRVVRQERRQFRVLEGGLGRNEDK